MLQTPPPVDLEKLKNILGNAKKVMEKTEKLNPSVNTNNHSQINENKYGYDERDEREIEFSQPTSSNIGGLNNYTPEQVMASKLPPAIKEAMLKNPIPQLQGPPSSFSLQDMGDLVEKPKNKVPLRESRTTQGADMITISKIELKEMIDERVNQIIMQSYTKTITEQAIKKTITTLINEGKILVKKK